MPNKTVHLYDDSNTPLQINGIDIQLIDSISGVLLDKQISANLNPSMGSASVDWGAVLSFVSGSTPLDIVITDINFRYPGNFVQYLNGANSDRIDLDLTQLPISPIQGQGGQPPITLDTALNKIENQKKWTAKEKIAVSKLVLNYRALLIRKEASDFTIDPDIEQNWVDAIANLGLGQTNFEAGKKPSDDFLIK